MRRALELNFLLGFFMACANCGSSILFGGKRSGDRVYCSAKCLNADDLGRQSDSVPELDVAKLARDIRRSQCPKCQQRNGVEIFKSYFVYSIVFMTSWKTKPALSCRSCARKQQAKDLVGSFFLGWWGIPFGIIATPIILMMNIGVMFRDPLARPPSKALLQHSRLLIADDILQRRENP